MKVKSPPAIKWTGTKWKNDLGLCLCSTSTRDFRRLFQFQMFWSISSVINPDFQGSRVFFPYRRVKEWRTYPGPNPSVQKGWSDERIIPGEKSPIFLNTPNSFSRDTLNGNIKSLISTVYHRLNLSWIWQPPTFDCHFGASPQCVISKSLKCVR